MKRFDLPLILDLLFIFAAFFFLSFTILRFYLDSTALSFWLGILTAALAGFIGFKLISPKHKNALLKRGDLDRKNEIFFNLALTSEKEVCEYLLKLFEKKGVAAKATTKGIILTDKNILTIPAFKLTAFNADDLAKIIQGAEGEKIALLLDAASGEAVSFAKKTGVTVVDGNSLFAIMKECDLYPPCPYRLSAREKIKIVSFNVELTRKKAKRFLLFGMALLLFSLVVAFPVYYLVSGNILIIISLFLKFYGKKEQVSEKLI